MPYEIHRARGTFVILTGVVAFVALLCNMLVGRSHDKWGKAYQFSVHAYEQDMYSTAHFTGPFLSTVHVFPSVNHTHIEDKSKNSHVHCSRERFPDDLQMDKCKMMRSAPLYLGNIANSWSVLGAQSTFVLTKHMLLMFLVFTIFWWLEYGLANSTWTAGWKPVWTRNAVVFIAVLVFVCTLATDVSTAPVQTVAIGSISTAFALVVIGLLVMCFEYATTDGERFELYTERNDVAKTDVEQNGKADVNDFNAHVKSKKEHMHRNIYLSYACLLTLPIVAVLILCSTRQAIVDVHIQLVFFSFIFYATLDVFQTRTTAVLLCLKHTPEKKAAEATTNVPENATPAEKTQNDTDPLTLLKLFVVVAFCLCKFFALMPALVLLQKYNTTTFAAVTIITQYVLLVGFTIGDLLQILFSFHAQMPPVDLVKLLVMLVYTCMVFFVTVTLDPAVDTPKS